MNQDPSQHPFLGKLEAVTNFGPGWEDPAHQDPAQIPCSICGDPTPSAGTKLCDRCYDLRQQLFSAPALAFKVINGDSALRAIWEAEERRLQEPAQQSSAWEVSVTCPVCLNGYHSKDEPDEWLRVNKALCDPHVLTPHVALLEAAHWLRAGAPGRALATIEAALAQGGAA